MSNIMNLTKQLSTLSTLLENARINNDIDEIERIEDEIDKITDELDELTDFEEHHRWH